MQPDTLIPDPTNPQAWNRYSYVGNNPIRFTDPTGHMMTEGCGDDGKAKCHASDAEADLNAGKLAKLEKEAGDRKCAAGNKNYCSTMGDLFSGDIVDSGQLNEENYKNTITAKAFSGDILSIIDFLVPTTYGGRAQLEGSFSFGGWSPSATIGTNIIYNRVSREWDSSFDFTFEPVTGGVGSGASLVVGPQLGWFSSTAKDVTSGSSVIVSGTGAGVLAGSLSVSAPLNANETKLHVDPTYGTIPLTYFLGVGVGGLYAGGGGGKTWTIYPENIFNK